jgi:hypothetical protein
MPFLSLAQKSVSFRPGKIWYDTDGNPINAHAGGFLYHEGNITGLAKL